MREICRSATRTSLARNSGSSNRVGSNWVKALRDTRGFRISCTMPEAMASSEARRSARRFSCSSSFSRERSLKTATAPRGIPRGPTRGEVEHIKGTICPDASGRLISTWELEPPPAAASSSRASGPGKCATGFPCSSSAEIPAKDSAARLKSVIRPLAPIAATPLSIVARMR